MHTRDNLQYSVCVCVCVALFLGSTQLFVVAKTGETGIYMNMGGENSKILKLSKSTKGTLMKVPFARSLPS